jgi:hypothetical protein
MVGLVCALTGLVLTVKVALLRPARMVTLAGTVADPLLLLSVTTTEAGAIAFNVTVPVELVPPTTEAGLRAMVETASVSTLRTAEADPLRVAVMVVVVDEVTEFVFTVNAAVVALAATVTEPGTEAARELVLASVTTAPPAGAGPVRVMVPVELETPPTTSAGDRVTDFT